MTLSVQYFRDPATGAWLPGSDKPGYSDKQVFEEAAALYLWMPGQFPDGIRLVDRHGFVRAGIHTKDTVSLLVRHHTEWVPASEDVCSVPTEIAQQWLPVLSRTFGANNVLPVLDRYPVHRFTDQEIAARQQAWRVGA